MADKRFASNMDKKSRVLVAVFLVIVGLSVIATFYRYIVLEDITFHTDEELFQESLLEEE